VRAKQVPYNIIPPLKGKVPILVSIPHCGVVFPKELKAHFHPTLQEKPDDTDWFVHQLYSFASEMGITIIHAHYSRWVIDLNRNPDSVPLYQDGRLITGLCPTSNFLGESIYVNEGFLPNSKEIQRRMGRYFLPYHAAIQFILKEMKKEFGKVLLWDAHSIRRKVTTIQPESFPDMILGNNDGQTAHQNLIEITLNALKNSSFEIAHNHPFKGGYITRFFGQPKNDIHALQLEMSKDLYMDETETNYHPIKAKQVMTTLHSVFEQLIKVLV
jgi:N-formylglutamate deformylase